LKADVWQTPKPIFSTNKLPSRLLTDITSEIEFTYFNIQDYQKPLRNADKADDNSLIALFKLTIARASFKTSIHQRQQQP
jgi:hypothetical protein